MCPKLQMKRELRSDGTLAVTMRRDDWFSTAQPESELIGDIVVRMRPYFGCVDDVKYCIMTGIQWEKGIKVRGAVKNRCYVACASRWTTVRACFHTVATRPASAQEGGAESHIQQPSAMCGAGAKSSLADSCVAIEDLEGMLKRQTQLGGRAVCSAKQICPQWSRRGRQAQS